MTNAQPYPQQPAYPSAPMWPEMPNPVYKTSNTLSIVTLVMGILAWFTIFSGIISSITGIIAYYRLPPRHPGRKKATTGLVLGVVPLAVMGTMFSIATIWIPMVGRAWFS